MANTFTQLYVHIVFAVKGRQNLISGKFKEELQKFINGITVNKGQKLLAVNCMPDHTHILIGIKPEKAIADIVRDIKANSSRFINEKKWITGKFNWQEGYGGFSYSHSQLSKVIKYIENQEKHHKKQTFKEEYISILEKFNVEYKNEHLFDWISY
jgi:putative transposase